MKKLLSLILSAALIAGCSRDNQENPQEPRGPLTPKYSIGEYLGYSIQMTEYRDGKGYYSRQTSLFPKFNSTNQFRNIQAYSPTTGKVETIDIFAKDSSRTRIERSKDPSNKLFRLVDEAEREVRK
jgi:nitrous oxide reductase accessory protein NosL